MTFGEALVCPLFLPKPPISPDSMGVVVAGPFPPPTYGVSAKSIRWLDNLRHSTGCESSNIGISSKIGNLPAHNFHPRRMTDC